MHILGCILIATFLILFVFFGLTVFIGAPYVPTLSSELEEAFTKLVKIGKDDLVVDFGSGYGNALKIATKHGAKALGIEINPILVLLSRWRLRKDKLAKVKLGGYKTVRLPKETTVIYLFCSSKDLKGIQRRLENEATRLGHPLKLISYGFQFDGLKQAKNHRAFFLYEITPKSNK